MLLNAYCPATDLHFSVATSPDITFKEFKKLCSEKCGQPVTKLKLYHDNTYLNNDKKTLRSYNLVENDLIEIRLHSDLFQKASSSKHTSSWSLHNHRKAQVSSLSACLYCFQWLLRLC